MKSVLILTPYINNDYHREVSNFIEELRKSTNLKIGMFSSYMFEKSINGEFLLAKHISIIREYKKLYLDKGISIFGELSVGEYYDLVFYVGIMPENQSADFELAYKSKSIIAQEIFLEDLEEIDFIKSIDDIDKKERFEKLSKLKKRIKKIIKKGK